MAIGRHRLSPDFPEWACAGLLCVTKDSPLHDQATCHSYSVSRGQEGLIAWRAVPFPEFREFHKNVMCT